MSVTMNKETTPMNILRGSLAFGLSIALSGCISLGSEPPPSLLTLTPETAVPAGAGASGTAATAIKIIPSKVNDLLK